MEFLCIKIGAHCEEWSLYLLDLISINYLRIIEQAGAELCQAQEKLSLAKPSLPRKKLWSSFTCQEIDVVFNFAKKLELSSIELF